MPPEIRESDVATQWDRNADVWTDQVRSRWDIFREHYNNPAFVEFAGDLSGKTVLDAGCGEGHNTRMFARAEEIREPLGIRYQRASFTDLADFSANSFDAEAWIDHWKFGHAPNAEQVEKFAVPRFDRTLSDYINPVIAAGLRLEEIREPRAPESACELYEAFRKFRDHIPLFLYVRASKS